MLPDNTLVLLHPKLVAVAPVVRVWLGDPSDKTTWTIQFADEATDEQKAAAQAVIDAFDKDAPIVPQTITPLQARKALRQAGVFEQVQAYVATLTPAEQDEWEYALEIRRDNAILVAGAAALSLDLDELFVLGATFK